MQCSFQKGDRLLKRTEYLRLGEVGQRLFSRHFIIVFNRTARPHARMGITVTKKIGSAVTRNRIKRICREYFRTHRDLLGDTADIHVIARRAAASAAHEDLTDSLEKLFLQIQSGSPSTTDRRANRSSGD